MLPLAKIARENPFVAAIDRRVHELEAQVLESPRGMPEPVKVSCRLRYP